MKLERCPDEEMIAAFASGRLAEPLREAMFVHFFMCAECRHALRFACECLISDKQEAWPGVTVFEAERAKRVFDLVSSLKALPSMSLLLWLRFSQALTPVREVMAAADGQTPDQRLQAAALSGHICFFSDCDKHDAGYWKARIALPVAPTPETELRIRIQDAAGRAIPQGTFVLCGIELPVSDGCATVQLTNLQGHLDKPVAALRFPDGQESFGTPRLFDED